MTATTELGLPAPDAAAIVAAARARAQDLAARSRRTARRRRPDPGRGRGPVRRPDPERTRPRWPATRGSASGPATCSPPTRGCSCAPAEPRRAARCWSGRRAPSPRACWPTPPTSGRWSTTPSTPRLWFLHALGRHVAHTDDLDLAAELSDTVVDDPVRASRRHQVRHRRRSRHRVAAWRCERVGPDLDGRAGRRAPGHAACRVPDRGRGALGQRAGDLCRTCWRAWVGASTSSVRCCGTRQRGSAGCFPRATRACPTWSTSRAPPIASADRTSSWRPPCPTARFATRRRSRASSPPVGPSC